MWFEMEEAVWTPVALVLSNGHVYVREWDRLIVPEIALSFELLSLESFGMALKM